MKICISNQKFGDIISAGSTDLRNSFISDCWYKVDKKEEYGFSSDQYLGFLYKELDSLIKLFNDYLVLVINELEITKNIQSPIDEIEQIYSFNYTKTFQRFYVGEQKIDYLHGRLGEDQNIVLGISNLTSQLLIDQKAYGFTKYHQKLLKQTDYSFLDDSTEVFKIIKRGRTIVDKGLKFFNFYIWGHSLDSSDQEYIHELFSFNLEKDQNVRVIVLYFNKQAKFDSLANLLDILEKEKVEKWMKKGWLKFEKNPNIAEINGIKPVELSKIETA